MTENTHRNFIMTNAFQFKETILRVGDGLNGLDDPASLGEHGFRTEKPRDDGLPHVGGLREGEVDTAREAADAQ